MPKIKIALSLLLRLLLPLLLSASPEASRS